MEGKDFLLALCQLDILGPSRLKRLGAYFNSWEKAWAGSLRELMLAGLEATVAQELITFRKNFSIEKLHHDLARHDIKTVAAEDPEYPQLLKQAYLPPLLYYRGSLELFKQPTLAIVGTRKVSGYGAQVTEHITAPLARAGISIVSGLALGVDTLAHEATLAADGLTAAVLGCGLDTIYPASNRRLAERIVEKGCLISEFKPSTPAYKTNFPRRNRIIAGLSLGTLVIEAAEKSGALSTARHALHENREVMAIPGNIFSPTSAGTNSLIKLGAKLVSSAADVLEALGMETEIKKVTTHLIKPSVDEAKLLAHLGYEPTHVDELARLTRLDISLINSRLTIMEINGLVKNTGNLSYVRLN